MKLGALDVDSFKLGSQQVDAVYLGSQVVWRNAFPPSAPNITSIGSNVGSVTINFTPSAGGLPTPTYDLFENGTRVAQNISSGFVRNVGAGTRNYYVQAVNSEGTANSNTVAGTSRDQPGSQTFTANGTFTGKVGYTSYTLCMIGGGGSGRVVIDGHGGSMGRGGHAGQVVNTTVTVNAGQNVTVTIGQGGAIRTGTGNGNAGGATSFGGTSAGGGAGGDANGYVGNGGSRSTCYGSANDGNNTGSEWGANGGQAGFGKGGNGNNQLNNTQAENGALGAGGGGRVSNNNGARSGAGGNGVVRISWS